MTRRSKRSIEHALEELESEPSASEYTPLEEVYPDDVAAFIKRLSRDLMRMRRHAQTVNGELAHGPDDEDFLAAVRDRYDLDAERDEEVRQALEEATAGSPFWNRYTCFSMAPMGIARNFTLETQEGETLTDLVHADREGDADRMLVRTAYEAFTDTTDYSVEVVD